MVNKLTESSKKTLKDRASHSYWISKEVYLQSFTTLNQKEIALVYHWRNHPEIRKWMFNKAPITLERHSQFISNLIHQQENYYWLVRDQKKELGVISLVIDKDRFKWGFYLNPDLFGSGYAIHLVYYALSFFFNKLNLKELIGFVNCYNTNSILLHHLFEIKHKSYAYRQNKKKKEWYSLRKINNTEWKKQNNSIKKLKKKLIKNKKEIRTYKKSITANLINLQSNCVLPNIEKAH